MRSLRNEIAPGSLKTEALAEYVEQAQRTTNEFEEYKQVVFIDAELIYEEHQDMNIGCII